MKLTFLICVFSYSIASAQLQFFSPDAMEGYTLFTGDSTFLVNNCGEVVHSWPNPYPSYHVKLLPTGNIVYIKRTIIDGLFHYYVIERDWDNNIVNQITLNEPGISVIYEVIVLENGNYLCVGRKSFSMQDFENIGYDLDLLQSTFRIDIVVELDRNTGDIVWEWDITDHVIQERSDTIPNYGIVEDHPELINMDANPIYPYGESWMINGMDYNPALDQIVLSLRKMSEIIIIDHSTTTAEAATNSGGNSGKGGDILYRWGHPENYNRGTASDRQLYYQHNPNWIQYGQHAGKIIIYNNGAGGPDIPTADRYSTASIITPPIIADGNYHISDTASFGPDTPTENYGLPGSGNHFYSAYTSASRVLPNENILITVGDDHRVIELKPDGTLAWEYQLASAGFTFRAEKYPEDYPAFENRDLTPQGTIENPPSTVFCGIVSSTATISENSFKAWVDQGGQQLYVTIPNGANFDLALFDLLGKKMWKSSSSSFLAKVNEVTYNFLLPQSIQGVMILSWRDQQNGQQGSVKLFVP